MVKYAGGSGESIEAAIIILDAKNHAEGVRAEYEYLEGKFGKRGEDWRLKLQELVEDGGKHYDLLDIIFTDGTEKSIYFDISAFFMYAFFDGPVIGRRSSQE